MPPTSEQQKFVPRVEMAIMQYVIVHHAQKGEVTRDNLKQLFRGGLQMSSDHFDHCIQQLVQDGHLKEVGGNKYVATDDGREDVQKLQTVVLELGNFVGQGQGQKQGISQQQTAGGRGGSASTGGTQGNQGDYGTSSTQSGGIGQGQTSTSGAQTGAKGGATSPTTGGSASGGQQNKGGPQNPGGR